ncbi:hypothetical protein RQP46_001976 [Phenoliferia psychrophenolica]
MATLANEPILSTPPPSPSFYKRKLPESCIPFASTKGKALFKTALLEGNLEGYFPLASQFITQNEPAFCGLGTLCMVLNALEVDPQRKWKGPWRWYEQEMLDCCRPLSAVAAVGISLPEFACLARCNGLSAKITSPSLTATGFEAEQCIEAFRADLRAAAKGHGALALSYSRKTLGQTGDGHFSPIGGFCEEEDMVLVLDVARFKYPSYWIPTALAWESMKPLDKATGQPRGYAVLSLLPESDPSSITSPLSHTSLTLNKSTWAVLATQLTKILLSTPRTSSASSLLHSLSSVLSKLPSPPLAARPSSVSSLPSLLSPLVALAPPLPSDPFAALFLLALLSPKVSLAKLVPDHLRIELRQLVDGACKEGDVGREVEVLATQLAALGECAFLSLSLFI